jgi:hypothetical protein
MQLLVPTWPLPLTTTLIHTQVPSSPGFPEPAPVTLACGSTSTYPTASAGTDPACSTPSPSTSPGPCANLVRDTTAHAAPATTTATCPASPSPSVTSMGTGSPGPWRHPTLVSTRLSPEPSDAWAPPATAPSAVVGPWPSPGPPASGYHALPGAEALSLPAPSPLVGCSAGGAAASGGAFRFPKPWVGSSSRVAAMAATALTPQVVQAVRGTAQWWALPSHDTHQ